MPQENVQMVRRICEAWARGDFQVGAGDLDRHVVFVVRPDFPEFGVFHGPDGVNEYMHRFLENWERYTLEATRVEPVGDTVLVRFVQRGTGRESGIEVVDSLFMLFTFRGRRIVRLESVRTEGEAFESVGLPEPRS
jgi:ketosteroid isomerase-like protein